MRSLIFGAALSLAAVACGQKGPLYLRDNPPPGMKPAGHEYKPVPYPKDASQEAPQGSERGSPEK
jgi:predicted small lipoprotein YifL